MPYAIGYTLDKQTSTIVNGVWQELADREVSSQMLTSPFRPHITLGIADELDKAACKAFLAEFAERYASFPIILSSVGVFPRAEESAVFFGVTVTADLLVLHADFHRTFSVCGEGLRDYYRPGIWVPHCTLADGLPCELLPRAIEICHKTELPITACADGINVLQFPPGNELFTLPVRSNY